MPHNTQKCARGSLRCPRAHRCPRVRGPSTTGLSSGWRWTAGSVGSRSSGPGSAGQPRTGDSGRPGASGARDAAAGASSMRSERRGGRRAGSSTRGASGNRWGTRAVADRPLVRRLRGHRLSGGGVGRWLAELHRGRRGRSVGGRRLIGGRVRYRRRPVRGGWHLGRRGGRGAGGGGRPCAGPRPRWPAPRPGRAPCPRAGRAGRRTGRPRDPADGPRPRRRPCLRPSASVASRSSASGPPGLTSRSVHAAASAPAMVVSVPASCRLTAPDRNTAHRSPASARVPNRRLDVGAAGPDSQAASLRASGRPGSKPATAAQSATSARTGSAPAASATQTTPG